MPNYETDPYPLNFSSRNPAQSVRNSQVEEEADEPRVGGGWETVVWVVVFATSLLGIYLSFRTF